MSTASSTAYRDLLHRLFALRRMGMRLDLDHVREVVERLGSPCSGRTIVHIGGTNGKGSTAAFVESMLRAAGVRTALFTSPHLARFTERFRIEGREIEPARAVEAEARVRACARRPLTFFESATAMALVLFEAAGVEVAVMEVGLGGRLDATNVLDPAVVALTGVALDHTDILGPTVTAIAAEKAGILKPGRPAVTAADGEALAVVRARARAVGAPLAVLGEGFDLVPEAGASTLAWRGPGGPIGGLSLGLAGAHQVRNAAVALAAVGTLAEGGRVARDPAAWARGLAATRWPARCELVPGRPALLLDAAHNPDGAAALARALGERGPARRTLVVGVVRDKDAAGVLAPLLPLCERVIVTRPPSPRARPPADLARGVPGAEVIADPMAAVAAARAGAGPDDLVVVCGSVFLVGAVRAACLGEPVDPIAAQDPPAAAR